MNCLPVRSAGILVMAMTALLIAACKPESESAKAPPVRPVLTVLAEPAGEKPIGFSGTIQPRFQADLAFRVLGRIIARQAEVGDLVTPGQSLAQLDPLVLDLAVRSSEADLARARAQLANATGAEERASTLLARQVANQADFDNARQAREAAAASLEQMQANLDKAREQRSYATLASDMAGVVTATYAEIGQTVSAGTRVMTVARIDVREAVVDLPDEAVRSLSPDTAFTIALQADPALQASGKVREIAPQADAATRTRRVRIMLDQFSDAFRLGATITAVPRARAADPAIVLPRSALLERDGATRVWIADPESRTVKSVPVTLGRRDEAEISITGGLAAGARVVVAGVNSLIEGQQVKLDERAAK